MKEIVIVTEVIPSSFDILKKEQKEGGNVRFIYVKPENYKQYYEERNRENKTRD